MGGNRRHIAGWATVLSIAWPAIGRAGPVADVPTDDPSGFGYNQQFWPKMTAALNADASTPIVTIPDLSNLPQLMQYSGLWVDVRFSSGLSANESANLQAYIASGRRVVLIGASYTYGTWDSSVLSAVGGSFDTSSDNLYTEYIPNNTRRTTVTYDVAGVTVAGAGFATVPAGVGTKLFDQPVGSLWGPAGNAVVFLDTVGLSSGFTADYFSANSAFANNLATWVTGNLSAGTYQWTGPSNAAWTAASCWNQSSMPSSGDDALFAAGSTGQTISIPSPVSCRNLTVSSTNVTLDLPAAGNLAAFGALAVSGSSTLSLTRSTGTSTATVSAASVNIAAGSTLSIGAGDVLSSPNISGGVTIAGSPGHWTGTLDIGNGSADLTGVTLATVTGQVRSGYNLVGGGNWTGTGITSSAAAADTAHLHAVGVMAGNFGDVIARCTLVGDANLDGVVDGSDYSLIDAGFASAGKLTGWTNGDFNYDGVIDGSDYALIDNAFHNQSTASAAEVATITAQVAAVPEPVSITGIPLLIVLLGRKAHRRVEFIRRETLQPEDSHR